MKGKQLNEWYKNSQRARFAGQVCLQIGTNHFLWGFFSVGTLF